MARSLMLLVVALVLTTGIARADRKLVVVVARGSSVTNISRTDLKRCFLGDPISGGGKTLVPFNAEARTPARSGFDLAILGMTPDETGRFWVDRKIRGESSAPRSLPSMLHVIKVIAKFPGAIGYVPADQLTPELQPVQIDGVAYTSAAYPIVVEQP